MTSRAAVVTVSAQLQPPTPPRADPNEDIFTFGDAGFFGSTSGTTLAEPLVAMAPTPLGKGYWSVARDGGIFAFGDARFFGSAGGTRLAQSIVGMAAEPGGSGYWLAASDGGIFAFGNAQFFGSMGNQSLDGRHVVGFDMSPTGRGYMMVTNGTVPRR